MKIIVILYAQNMAYLHITAAGAGQTLKSMP